MDDFNEKMEKIVVDKERIVWCRKHAAVLEGLVQQLRKEADEIERLMKMEWGHHAT